MASVRSRVALTVSFEWFSDQEYLVELEDRSKNHSTQSAAATAMPTTSSKGKLDQESSTSGFDHSFVEKLIQRFRLRKLQEQQFLCPFENYEDLKSLIQSFPNCQINDIPSPVHATLLRHRNRNMSSTEAATLLALPARLHSALRHFQIEAVEYGVNRKGKMLLADEMGTGKTVQAIALMRHYVPDWPLLVVCPSSLKWMWANEFQRWLPELQPGDLSLIRGGRMANALFHPVAEMFGKVITDSRNNKRSPMKAAVDVVSQELRHRRKPHTRFVNNKRYVSHFPPVAIISYTLLSQWFQRVLRSTNVYNHQKDNQDSGYYNVLGKLLADAFPSLIADEAHCLRRPDSRKTMSVMNVAKHASRAVLLTGTPCLSKPLDLFPILHCLRPHIFKTRLQFAMRYCDPEKHYSADDATPTWSFGGVSRSYELNALLEKEVMIRRLKEQVLPELPPKCRQCIMLTPPINNSSWKSEVDKTVKAIRTERQQRYQCLCTHTRFSRLLSELASKNILAANEDLEKIVDEVDIDALRNRSANVDYIADILVPQSSLSGLHSAYYLIHNENDAASREFLEMEPNDGANSESEDTSTDPNDGVADNVYSSFDHWQGTGIAKAGSVAEYALECLKAYRSCHYGIKILIFAHHSQAMDKIQRVLLENQVKMVRVDGKMLPSERLTAVDQFQTDTSVSVALVSMTAGGEGHCFNAANLVLFAELHHLAGILLQAEDRAHRMKSTTSSKGKTVIDNGGRVTIQYLVARETCDDLLWGRLCHRLKAIGKTINGAPIELAAETGDASTRCLESLNNQEDSSVGDELETASPLKSRSMTPISTKKMISSGDLSQELYFIVSAATHRVYIYTSDEQYTGLNFIPEEHIVSSPEDSMCRSEFCVLTQQRGMIETNKECHNDNDCELPLLHRLDAASTASCDCWLRAAHLFSLDWCSINAVTKEELCHMFLSLPLGPIVSSLKKKDIHATSQGGEEGSTCRYAPVTGAIKYSQVQRVQNSLTEDKLIYCANCSTHVPYPVYVSIVSPRASVNQRNGVNDHQTSVRKYAVPFCGEKCNRTYWGKRRSGTIRSYLSELEQGVCQICGIDARKIFREVSSIYREEQLRVEKLYSRRQQSLLEWKARFILELVLLYRTDHSIEKVHSRVLDTLNDSSTGKALEDCETKHKEAENSMNATMDFIENNRIDHILKTDWKPRKNTTSRVLKKATALIRNPQEGSFWQADHILPVIEGGGSCGWTNFRTLCTACHRVVTGELRARLKQKNRQSNEDVKIIDLSQTDCDSWENRSICQNSQNLLGDSDGQHDGLCCSTTLSSRGDNKYQSSVYNRNEGTDERVKKFEERSVGDNSMINAANDTELSKENQEPIRSLPQEEENWQQSDQIFSPPKKKQCSSVSHSPMSFRSFLKACRWSQALNEEATSWENLFKDNVTVSSLRLTNGEMERVPLGQQGGEEHTSADSPCSADSDSSEESCNISSSQLSEAY